MFETPHILLHAFLTTGLLILHVICILYLEELAFNGEQFNASFSNHLDRGKVKTDLKNTATKVIFILGLKF